MTDLHTLESQRRDVAASLKLVERKRDELAARLEKLDALIEAARWEMLSEEYGVQMYHNAPLILTQELQDVGHTFFKTGSVMYMNVLGTDVVGIWTKPDTAESCSGWAGAPIALVAAARRAYLEREASHE